MDLASVLDDAIEALATALERLALAILRLAAWIRTRFREAGSPEEASTERDGILSYAAETHAVGYGIALGFAIVAPHPEIKALVLLVLACGECNRWRLDRRVFREIREEPQYFGPVLAITAGITAYLYGVI